MRRRTAVLFFGCWFKVSRLSSLMDNVWHDMLSPVHFEASQQKLNEAGV